LPANQSIGLTAAQDPYKLFRLARNGYQAGHIDLMRGVIPYQGMAPEGPSLREVIVQAVGGEGNADWSDDNLLAFGGYLVSRRMVREYARFDAGEIDRVPDKYSLGDHEQAIRDLEAAYPSFRNAATLVYDYQRNILRKLYEGGILTDEQYQDYVNRDDYVPVNRVMDDDGVGGAVDGAGKFSPIKRFRGSTRDIINPLESIAKFSYEVNYMIRRNDGVRAIEALARAAGPGGGAIAERIPASEMRGTRIDVIDAVRQAGRQQGVDDADMVFMLQSIEDTLGEDADAILFRPGEINEGGEPIVYLWEGGKRVPIRLADGNFGRELYRAITQITPVVQAEVLIKAFTAPSQFLRAGITLDPAFLAANYFRDQLSAWMLTEDFTPFTDGARGTYDAVRSSYGAEVADLDMFNALGGIMGGEGVEGLNEARWNKDVRELRRKGVRMAPWRWNPLGRDFWTWTGWTETGTRLQMFRNARQRALRDGMNEHEAMMEAAFTSNDYIDFGRYGSRMMTTKRMVLFLNAALQGLDKARRVAMGQSENTRTVGEIVSPYIRHTDGQPLTVQERKRLGVAAKFWAKIAVYSALGFALFLLYQDDDEFEEIDEYHRVHSHLFKINGQWVRLPRPFELGAFGYAMEKAYEAHYKGDETAYNHMREGIASLVTPPHSIPGIQVAFEVATNTKLPFGDGIFSAMFKSMKGETVGRPIVPLHLQDETPEEQYTAYTSEFVKWLAQQTGVSAAKLEHIITGLGGGLGRAFLGTTDMIATETGLAERVSDAQDAVFVKRFTLDPVRSARAKREFWDQMSRTSDGLMRSAMNYKQDMQFGRTEASQAKLARMTEQQRAFAILHAHGDINERRRHPMQRAYDVIGVLNAVRRDLGQGLPDSEGNPYTLDDRRVVKVIIEQLQMREARNALVLIGQPGYRQRSILTTDAIWKELQTKVPDLYEEIEHRLDSKKVQDFDDVRADWPDLRRDLLSGDYAADNPVDQKSLRKSN